MYYMTLIRFKSCIYTVCGDLDLGLDLHKRDCSYLLTGSHGPVFMSDSTENSHRNSNKILFKEHFISL